MPSTAISRDSPPASPLQPASYEEVLANAEPGDTIATRKEEEWVTRKKAEVTTTRQIATRVKRELVLEDGRILKDSGPKISTSVNEDTHTTNFQKTEHRVPADQNGGDDPSLGYSLGGALGAPVDEVDGPHAVLGGEVAPAGGQVVVSSRVVANPDGKVRESRDLKVLTRNVTERVNETEERFHRGDTTHDALIAAVNETSEDDIREALRTQTEQQLALVPRGPRVVKDTVAYKTTVDRDDTKELRALQADGTIVTERRHTKEQEQLGDEDLPPDEARSLASDKSVTEKRGGRERRARVELEHSTDLMAGGRRVATHLHSRTRTEEAEREGQPNMDEDWDSLSVRMRRQRRLRQAELDKDYKRPSDFDIEEETRKKETSKWLESHFGSDSQDSHDSIAEEIGRRPDTYYVKTKTPEDEGYYGKNTSAPPPPVYGDRVLRKTKSSTPSDERPVPVNRTGGYFKGVADWSQRRASKPRMPEPRSSSPSPPAVRSPYNSNDRLNGSSPRHVYGKRDSPQGRSSPLGRRHPPSRDDSAYVSSSTMHSPPRGSPFRPLETDRSFREPSVDEDYRPPIAPERKRHSKQRLSEEQRYDSGYRSSSRNENSGRSRDSRDEGAAEPPPDYSPPLERRGSSDRDRTPPPRRRERDERKQHQKTRFATESARRPSPVRKSVGSAIGNSIRKLVGKIRSASAERRARWRSSRSPSPAEHSSRTYRQYGGELSPPAAPTHRYYLGEDPFAPSIYGREHKYEGSARRATASDARDRERGQFSSTLGRFSHSTSRLNPNSEPEEEYSRSAQTLPRKLHDRKNEKSVEKPSSNKYWHRLTPSKRSSSAVNVSHHVATEGKSNGYPPGPAKPARTNKVLNRSKSFAMGAPEPETQPRYVSGMSRNYSTMYKSNPHLSRLDETPEQLKSPGIVSIINRSQRDLADAVSRETERRRDGLFGARYGKTTPISNGHTNGYGKYDETDKKKMFLKGLRERAPELYHTLHAEDESDGSRLSSRYNTPSPGYKDRASEERKTVYKTESLNRDTSPFVSRLDTRLKSPAIRRGSNSSDNYSETYRYTTRSGDPERPSVTDTVETVSKKVVPGRDGRSKEIIESREVNSVTKSRGFKEPLSLKYIENGTRSSPLGFESRNGSSPLYSERRSSNYKVLEKIRDY